MNLNPIFTRDFREWIGYPVEQDEYEGDSAIYFVFSYEDEVSVLYGDNKAVDETAYMQLKLYTPKNYDYFELKKQTGEFFERLGFTITSKHSFLESNILKDTKRMRCTVFEMNYTAGKMEEL